MKINEPITSLSGIGEKRAGLFRRLGVYTMEDLITYYPREYDDRSEVRAIESLMPGTIVTIRAMLRKDAENVRIKDKTITKLVIQDETGILEVAWFNQPYLKNIFKKNSEFFFTGRITDKFRRLQMESPDYEAVGEQELLSSGRIVPIYPGTLGLSQKVIRKMIKAALEQTTVDDFLPQALTKKYALCSKQYAVENIHFPRGDEAFFAARKRLVFEELFLMQLTLLKMKGIVKSHDGYIIGCDNEKDILEVFPYSLTIAQQSVLDEIKNDMRQGTVMNRLIQGDVGSGKTAVALVASFFVISEGYQAALMAPTEVLAGQHYTVFCLYLERMGIETVLLTGSLSKKEKEQVYEKIKTGTAKMVVGTHALIQEAVAFDQLALVITDEQHRFGVNQRFTLAGKGRHPHALVMSATPIPRTLGLILYGDMDVSVIDQLPPGRQKIKTHVVDNTYRTRLYGFIEKEMDAGRQVYVICPAIEESGMDGLQSVLSHSRELKSFFASFRVECLHGRLKASEKQSIMDAFSTGEIQLLVSTTVIEVGVNVPNATVMVIENAERFGLSQLHQLRGRVGRGDAQSYCILVSNGRSEGTKERLAVMKKTGDGFVISEMDMKLRGPGDFFGTRQHGLPEFKLANLYQEQDMGSLKIAQKAALDVHTEAFPLSREEKAALDENTRGVLKPQL